ncbi:MAG TPA: hypothetical protein VGQ76_23975 [Thermoanaerobaculia bacterium]|jgi:hypothetical protein|nr:hypothetical protein [Thermoanaerobaculia bacterium]
MKTPSPEYWDALIAELTGSQPVALRDLFATRITTFTGIELPPPESSAIALLDRFAADGFLEKQLRINEDGIEETIYVRDLAPARVVDWLIAIHGMNTTGAWQESFTWKFSTTWGRSVPIAIYKYGIIIAGVVMAWRCGKLRENLREKLAVLRDEAQKHGFNGKPDLIAHSFGTWLFGHLLERELTRENPLKFGRVILTGCILRPDFDWQKFLDAGLVDDVLNHYGTADAVVPLAHTFIHGSGPSGRRGFDGDGAINVRAEGFGHSDLFSMENLERSYTNYWRPFLTLPREELRTLPDIADPATPWRAMRLPVFPLLILLLAAH